MADTPGVESAALPTVLLVDDEPLFLALLGKELNKTYRLYTAASVSQADLRLAARSFDVVICDHMLPGEQGLDFLTRLSQMLPSTKRILITGYTNPEFIARSMQIAGLSACLVKPIKPSQITAAVQAALSS
jgi:response regulator RpfG family c-di-GMP phosphodiesterase